MASVFGHAITGWALTGSIEQPRRQIPLIIVLMSSTMIPDLDILAFDLGIPYDHVLGHRGITHSLSFACIWALLWMWALSRYHNLTKIPRWRLFLLLFVATASHGILDGMTTGGMGVAYFAPFDDGRYFLPWRMIQVSPLGVNRFFSAWGVSVLFSELLWVGIPAVIVYGFLRFARFTKKDE